MNKIKLFPVLILVLVAASTNGQRSTSGGGRTCPDSCPDSTRPVCGTDNRTYRNECHLRRAACQNVNIRKRSDGPCVGSSSSSSNSQPTLRCERDCSRSDNYNQVCASNGVTYENECEFENAQCFDPTIKQNFIGVCDVKQPVQNTQSSQPSAGNVAVRPATQLATGIPRPAGVSSSSNQRPSIGGIVIGAAVNPFASAPQPAAAPQPPTLPPTTTRRPPVAPSQNCIDRCSDATGAPVCGTDGQVYPNECKLQVAICRNPGLRKRNDGVCVKDCSLNCPQERNNICGSDGKTYLNECEFRVARCKDGSISKIGDGNCRFFRQNPECIRQNCERQTSPVCGSDGVTYANLCLLIAQSCIDQSLIRIHDGECPSQRCGECLQVLEPVCGSDGRTYPNHCILINTACRNQSNLLKRHDGPCRVN